MDRPDKFTENRELSWCQLCRHRRLSSWKRAVLQMTTTSVSWRLLIFRIHQLVFMNESRQISMGSLWPCLYPTDTYHTSQIMPNELLTATFPLLHGFGWWFNINMSSCQYKILQSFYLHNGTSYPGLPILVRRCLFIESGRRTEIVTRWTS